MDSLTTNEQIALELGWTRFYPHWGHSHHGWHAPQPYRNAKCWHLRVPDFEHDWAHAGSLLEELPDNVLVKISMHNSEGEKFQCKLTRGLGAFSIGYGKTRKAALSHAWLAWKKEEKSSD